MDPATITLIAAGQVVLLAVINGLISARATRQAAALKSAEKKEDWRRQDEVAERVAKAEEQAARAAALLLKAQKETIARTDEVARLAAEANQRIASQLAAIDAQGNKIHILVNSDMTAARTAERDSLKLLVLALRNSHALARKLGLPAEGNEDDEILRVEERVAELDQILADRLAAQHRVDTEEAGRKGTQ